MLGLGRSVDCQLPQPGAESSCHPQSMPSTRTDAFVMQWRQGQQSQEETSGAIFHHESQLQCLAMHGHDNWVAEGMRLGVQGPAGSALSGLEPLHQLDVTTFETPNARRI